MKLLKFVYALIKYIFTGTSVNASVYRERLSICNTCSHLKNDQCNICGCYVKRKAKWSTESCPKNKW
jgi:hypothetical protein